MTVTDWVVREALQRERLAELRGVVTESWYGPVPNVDYETAARVAVYWGDHAARAANRFRNTQHAKSLKILAETLGEIVNRLAGDQLAKTEGWIGDLFEMADEYKTPRPEDQDEDRVKLWNATRLIAERLEWAEYHWTGKELPGDGGDVSWWTLFTEGWDDVARRTRRAIGIDDDPGFLELGERVVKGATGAVGGAVGGATRVVTEAAAGGVLSFASGLGWFLIPVLGIGGYLIYRKVKT